MTVKMAEYNDSRQSLVPSTVNDNAFFYTDFISDPTKIFFVKRNKKNKRSTTLSKYGYQ